MLIFDDYDGDTEDNDSDEETVETTATTATDLCAFLDTFGFGFEVEISPKRLVQRSAVYSEFRAVLCRELADAVKQNNYRRLKCFHNRIDSSIQIR